MAMQHEQQDPAVRYRLALLLPLLALSISIPYLIEYHEQQQAYQWEDMLRQQWYPMPPELILPVTPAEEELQPPSLPMADGDVAEWKTIDTTPEPPVAVVEVPPALPASLPKTPPRAAQKPVAPAAAAPKPKHLKLKLPDNPYQGEVADWEEAPPLPDLFAPKPSQPSRWQLGGRLITDDDVKEKNPEADFLDTVKGAEINVTIKTN